MKSTGSSPRCDTGQSLSSPEPQLPGPPHFRLGPPSPVSSSGDWWLTWWPSAGQRGWSHAAVTAPHTRIHCCLCFSLPTPIFLSLEQKISLTSHGQHSCPTGCKHRSEWSQWRDESLHNRVIYACPPPPLPSPPTPGVTAQEGALCHVSKGSAQPRAFQGRKSSPWLSGLVMLKCFLEKGHATCHPQLQSIQCS